MLRRDVVFFRHGVQEVHKLLAKRISDRHLELYWFLGLTFELYFALKSILTTFVLEEPIMWQVIEDLHGYNEAMVVEFLLEVQDAPIVYLDATLVKQSFVVLSQKLFALLSQLWTDLD